MRVAAQSRTFRRTMQRDWALAACCTLLALPVISCTDLTRPTATAPPPNEFALSPGQTVVGAVRHYVVQKDDVFADIARHFDVGYTALVAANPGVDPWVPPVGRTITIPSMYILPRAPHRGIVVNLAQWRLFYFPPDGERVQTYPVGLGVIGRHTPIGDTHVIRKEPHPTWYPPPSIRAERPELPGRVPPGPDNPLGDFALRLSWPNYLIHGTNKPDGVGRNVSHGCLHLYPEDIAKLFGEVRVGTEVRTVNQPTTAGWLGDRLYVEIYPSQKQTEEIDTAHPVSAEPAHDARAAVEAAAGRAAKAVDWQAVAGAAAERTGMPVTVADRSAEAERPAEPRKLQRVAATGQVEAGGL